VHANSSNYKETLHANSYNAVRMNQYSETTALVGEVSTSGDGCLSVGIFVNFILHLLLLISALGTAISVFSLIFTQHIDFDLIFLWGPGLLIFIEGMYVAATLFNFLFNIGEVCVGEKTDFCLCSDNFGKAIIIGRMFSVWFVIPIFVKVWSLENMEEDLSYDSTLANLKLQIEIFSGLYIFGWASFFLLRLLFLCGCFGTKVKVNVALLNIRHFNVSN